MSINGCNLILVAALTLGTGAMVVNLVVTRPSRRPSGECVFCGYSLRGDCSYVCPECGRRPPHPWFPSSFVGPKLRRSLNVAAMLLVAAVGAIAFARVTERRAWGGNYVSDRTAYVGMLLPAILATWAAILTIVSTHDARRAGSSARAVPVAMLVAAWLVLSFVLMGVSIDFD